MRLLPKTLTALLLLPTLFLLSGCFLFSGSESESPTKLTSVDLYMARAGLFKTEYEQFKLTPGLLYVECGEIKYGRSLPAVQMAKRLGVDSFIELAAELKPNVLSLSKGGSALSGPGNLSGMADEGQVYLEVKSSTGLLQLRTNLDTLVRSEVASAAQLSSLAKRLRSFAQQTLGGERPLCGNQSFYGL